MKTPTWAIIIGSIMLLFGGCSALNYMSTVFTPMVFDMQEDVFDEIEREIETSEEEIDEFPLNMMRNMFDVSDYTMKWIVRFGYIGVFISLFYMMGGAFLLIRRRISIRLAYAALILSMVFSIVKAVVLSQEGNLFSLSAGVAAIGGIVVNIILLAIIIASEKEAYETA